MLVFFVVVFCYFSPFFSKVAMSWPPWLLLMWSRSSKYFRCKLGLHPYRQCTSWSRPPRLPKECWGEWNGLGPPHPRSSCYEKFWNQGIPLTQIVLSTASCFFLNTEEQILSTARSGGMVVPKMSPCCEPRGQRWGWIFPWFFSERVFYNAFSNPEEKSPAWSFNLQAILKCWVVKIKMSRLGCR